MADPDYAAFFLNTAPSVVLLELIEITHPAFTQTYRVVRNATAGVTVTQAAPFAGVRTYVYYPLSIKPLETNSDMDQAIKIDLGDLQGLLQDELDNVSDAGMFYRKPTVTYRVYDSTDLTAELYGPINLEIEQITFTKTAVSFEAVARILSRTRTGELYTLDRFPMLKYFDSI